MIASNFIDLVNKYKFTNSVGLEDVADKASFIVSVAFLLISTLIVTLNTLVFQPLACFSSVTPSGMNYEKFVENYCWLEGTFGFSLNESFPTLEDLPKYDHLKIGYYQWIPFALAMQCVLFYLPRVLWQAFCYNKIGVDLESLIFKATTVRNDDKCNDKCKPIAEKIASILYCHRDYRQGAFSTLRRNLYSFMGVIVASKRLGTWLVSRYFLMKLLYLVNAIVQLILLNKFFKSDTNFVKYGYDIVVNIFKNQGETLTKVFPKVAFCFVNVNVFNNVGHYVSQCALPQNMINEKIFAFLYLWIALVAVVTVFGIFVWIKRTSYRSRTSFIKKSLDIDLIEANTIHKFATEFLQHDGHFIIQMIYINAGDIVTTSVLRHLLEIYEHSYVKVDLRKDPYYKVTGYTENSMAMRLETTGANAVKRNTNVEADVVSNFI